MCSPINRAESRNHKYLNYQPLSLPPSPLFHNLSNHTEDRDNKKKEKIIGQDVWGDRPQMFVEVNGMRVLVLADSGATCSGASSWIFQQITGESVIIEGIMRGATGVEKINKKKRELR